MSQVCHKSTKYTFNFLCHLWEGVLKHISSEMSPLWFHKRHWCFIDISPRLLISAAKGVFPPSETTSLPLIRKVQQSKVGRYLQQCREEHDCQRSHQLILTLLLNLNTKQGDQTSTCRDTLCPPGVLCALPPLWSSWWSAVGEWGSSLDPSSPSPPGSSGSWTDPPNTSALEEWQAEINKDPQFSKQKESDTRKTVCEWQGCELTKRRNVNFKSDISYNITLWYVT